MFAKQNIIFAGYSNDVMSYVANKRIISEGGYEASDSMIYYGLPGPYAPEVEERMKDSIKAIMGRVGVK